MNIDHAPVVELRPYCSACGRQLTIQADGSAVHVETFRERHVREEAEYRAEKKKREGAQFAASVRYKGRITRCMASKSPARGAPYRCVNKPSRVVRSSRDDHRPMAVCGGCARNLHVGPYTGWAADPNPNLPTVEPEYVALLPDVPARAT